jgi:hypothetical protein
MCSKRGAILLELSDLDLRADSALNGLQLTCNLRDRSSQAHTRESANLAAERCPRSL